MRGYRDSRANIAILENNLPVHSQVNSGFSLCPSNSVLESTLKKEESHHNETAQNQGKENTKIFRRGGLFWLCGAACETLSSPIRDQT